MYTKGEWKAVYYKGIGWSVETARDQICGLEPGKASSGVLPLRKHEANAQLIASAPDLYEALKRIFERANRGLPLDRTVHLIPAEKALAKAENLTNKQ